MINGLSYKVNSVKFGDVVRNAGSRRIVALMYFAVGTRKATT